MTDTYTLTPEQLDSIRELAYEKFVARGCENGHDLEDWLAAEREVQACCTEHNGEATAPETVRRARSTKSAKGETRTTTSSATKS